MNVDFDIAHELIAAWRDLALTLSFGDAVSDAQHERCKRATEAYETHVAERMREAG